MRCRLSIDPLCRVYQCFCCPRSAAVLPVSLIGLCPAAGPGRMTTSFHIAPTIDHQHGPGDVRRLVRREPQDRKRDLARLGPALHEAALLALPIDVALRAPGRRVALAMKRRERQPRADRVDAHTVLRLLERERLGHRDDAGFGYVVL